MERVTGGKRKGLALTPLAVFVLVFFLFQVTPSPARQPVQNTVPIAALEVVHRAAVPAEELIDERRAQMKDLGEYMRALARFIKGTAGTRDQALSYTTGIMDLAEQIPTLFPKGTGMEDGLGIETGAKQKIWDDWYDFEALAKLLSNEVDKLAAAVSAGAERSAVRQQFMQVGKKGCSGCHDGFRHKLRGTD
ncbi:MAG: cytochrome c [Pseudomonadota bacterium]